MVYAIIAAWDVQMRVSRYNYVETELEAKAIIGRKTGVSASSIEMMEMSARLSSVDFTPNERLHFNNWLNKPLGVAKQAPNAYYVLMPPAPAGTALFQHRARFWVADPANSTVSFDTVACHAWQSKMTSRGIDAEADMRIDKVFSPDDPSRAERVRFEMPDGAKKVALVSRVSALRTAAQILKDSLATKTPEEVLAVESNDNIHWPE